MKLSIRDRLVFEGLFPKQSNLNDQILARDIRAKVEVTQAEVKKYNIRTRDDGGGTIWDGEAPKTVEFSGAELLFLKKQIERLDRESAIHPDLVGLCLLIQDGKVKENEGDTPVVPTGT